MLKQFFKKAKPKDHWEDVYCEKAPEEVTWFQSRPVFSLDLIDISGADRDSRIIDVGGGASNLVDCLLEKGFRRLTVMDISAKALQRVQERLGMRSAEVEWLEADITKHQFSAQFDVWHDRAVFHFLTDDEDRRAYLRAVQKALRPGGSLIISTFGLRGPRKCSGLRVMRYSPETLHEVLGNGFTLLKNLEEIHQSPTGHLQQFIYCLFRKER